MSLIMVLLLMPLLTNISCFYYLMFNQIKKALRGVKVEVTHRGSVRRKYRISGMTSQPTRELMYDANLLYFVYIFNFL